MYTYYNVENNTCINAYYTSCGKEIFFIISIIFIFFIFFKDDNEEFVEKSFYILKLKILINSIDELSQNFKIKLFRTKEIKFSKWTDNKE